MNLDARTVEGFGDEWRRFPNSVVRDEERNDLFEQYFHIFPWERLPPDGGRGADVGCGSGRWSLLVAPRVRELHLVDASDEALGVARNNLRNFHNVQFHHSSLDTMPLEDGSLDFAFSLGVL